MPFVEMLRLYPRNILLGMGARYIDGVFFNIFAVFSDRLPGQYAEVSAHAWRCSAVIGRRRLVMMLLSSRCFGALSDQWGRPKTYAIGSFLLALCAYPGFWPDRAPAIRW